MPREARAGDEEHPFRFAEADALAENREIERLDAGEQRVVSMHQKPESAAAIGIDEIEQFSAFFIHLPGAVGFKAEQFADTESGFTVCEVLWRDVVAREILIGNVDAAKRGVFVHIAVLAAYAAVAYYVALVLTRRRLLK